MNIAKEAMFLIRPRQCVFRRSLPANDDLFTVYFRRNFVTVIQVFFVIVSDLTLIRIPTVTSIRGIHLVNSALYVSLYIHLYSPNR